MENGSGTIESSSLADLKAGMTDCFRGQKATKLTQHQKAKRGQNNSLMVGL